MSDARCGYPRPTVIPKCGRPRTSWEANRVILAPVDDDDCDDDAVYSLADDIIVPLTMRAIRRGPCVEPIEARCE